MYNTLYKAIRLWAYIYQLLTHLLMTYHNTPS